MPPVILKFTVILSCRPETRLTVSAETHCTLWPVMNVASVGRGSHSLQIVLKLRFVPDHIATEFGVVSIPRIGVMTMGKLRKNHSDPADIRD